MREEPLNLDANLNKTLVVGNTTGRGPGQPGFYVRRPAALVHAPRCFMLTRLLCLPLLPVRPLPARLERLDSLPQPPQQSLACVSTPARLDRRQPELTPPSPCRPAATRPDDAGRPIDARPGPGKDRLAPGSDRPGLGVQGVRL
jgi:hypothetical protein